MPTAVPAAIGALAAAWQTELTAAAINVPVGVGTPADLLQRAEANYVMGDVDDWSQDWGVTPYQGATALEGGIDETFTLRCRIYRRRAGATVQQLLTDIDADRAALETAIRKNRTLAGTLSASGMARIARAELGESLADDRSREVGLTVYVTCQAWVTP